MFGEADYIDVLNYNYDATTGEFTTELVSTNTDTVDGIPLAITFDASSYTVSVMGMMGSATLTAGTASGGDSGAATLDIAGEYIYNIYKEDGYSLDSRYQLIINADGTGTFKYRTWNKSNYTWTDTYTTTFTWTVAADGVSFDLVVTDYTYLQSGNYAYGSWTDAESGMTYEGILSVVILNGTSPAAYNLESF